MAEEFEGAATQLVAARPGREVDDTAVEPPELRRRTVALDLEFLDGIDVRKERDLPGLRLQHRDPVEQIFVGARPATVDARQLGSGRQGHRRDQTGQGDETAAVEREIDDLAVVDHLAESRGLTAHERRVPRHHDGFGQLADLELDVERHGLAGRDTEAVARERPEAREFDAQPIESRSEPLKDGVASGPAHRRARDIGGHRGQRHRCAWGRGAGLIGDDDRHRAGPDLCERYARHYRDQPQADQTAPPPPHPASRAKTLDRIETVFKSTQIALSQVSSSSLRPRSTPRRWRDALDDGDLDGSGRRFEYQSELVAQGGSE